MFYGKRFLIVLITLVSAIVWPGCSDTVIDPFSNDGKYYTIYGFLDVLETEHTVRVIPVTRHAERIGRPSDPQADIDAQVFSTDLRTGYRREWTHSLVQLEDGSYGHIFKSQFIINPLRTYRLEVVRSDGKMATAETTVPYIPDAALFEKGPEVFSPDSTELYQDIYIPRIASPWEIQGIYLWGGGGTINRRVYVQYGRSGYRTADGGWQMRLTISEDQAVVRENIQSESPLWVSSSGFSIRIGILQPACLIRKSFLFRVPSRMSSMDTEDLAPSACTFRNGMQIICPLH